MVSGRFKENLAQYIQVPKYGILTNKKKITLENPEDTLEKIWKIGGSTGWYYGD